MIDRKYMSHFRLFLILGFYFTGLGAAFSQNENPSQAETFSDTSPSENQSYLGAPTHSDTSVDHAIQLFRDANGDLPPLNPANRASTLPDGEKRVSLAFSTAMAPEANEPSLGLGLDFRYGWTPDVESSLTFARLVQREALDHQTRFAREILVGLRYRFITETYNGPSLTVRGGLAAMNNGFAAEGGLAAEKRISGVFLGRLDVSGRHRTNYTHEDYGFINIEPQVGWKIASALYFGTGVATTFYFEPATSFLLDTLGTSRDTNKTLGLNHSLALTPLLHYAISRETDLFLKGTVFLSEQARNLIGHKAEVGFSVSL